MERKKLELEINQPITCELLFDTPIAGQSRYGDYYLYALKNGDGSEYSFFAPVEVHEKLKGFQKGDKVELLKLAEQKGKKLVHNYIVKKLEDAPKDVKSDKYYEVMLQSCKDAMKIQTELGGLMDAKSLAVTLFIARSKLNGFGG